MTDVQLVKVDHICEKTGKTKSYWWIRKSVRLFGIHLWWQSTTANPYDSEEKALEDIELLTGDNYFLFRESRSVWHRDNCV